MIETCSGLRATELLTLVAILIVELSPHREPRAWLIVAIAPSGPGAQRRSNRRDRALRLVDGQ